MFGIKKSGLSLCRMLLALVCVLCLTLSVGAADGEGSDEDTAETVTDAADAYVERTQIASSDAIALYYTGETQLLEVEYKKSGYVWKSAVDPTLCRDLDLTDYWKTNLSALFQFSYYNGKKSDKANTLNSNSLSDGVSVTGKPLDNGVALTFRFADLGIRITVQITLEEDTVTLTIPEKSIKESNDYKLVSVSPLPFFGAASTGETGYLVYPDGSGALHNFNTKVLQNASALKLDIYGTRTWEEATVDSLRTQTVRSAMLPIFGMCRAGNTFVGVVEDEALESAIEVSQSGVSVPFERINSVFTYRRTYTVIKPDVKGGESSVVKMESARLPGGRSVKYMFLPTDSGYSGMANRYREYLLKTGKLEKRIAENADVPLMLDLFMGIAEERMLADKYIVMTNFEAAQTILSDLQTEGVSDIRANLIGWQKGGYGEYPNDFPAESKLGGNNGLETLNRWAASQGITLTLQDNVMLANADSGISKKNTCVYTKGSILLSDAAGKLLLISPKKTQALFADRLKKAVQIKTAGFSLEGLGEWLYPDYNDNNRATRREAGQIWQDILKETRKQTGYVSLVGGNGYLWGNADFLHHVTVHDSGYFLSDETIPLYQMVVHGYIPYTAEEPENLYYDDKTQWLQMLEYGTVPYFELTQESSNLLTDTEYNFLFTSQYEQWKDNLLTRVSTYNQSYKALYSSPMTEHKRLSDHVVRVTYENGMRLYVNYGEEPAEADGHTVGALDALTVSP